ncbi:pentapeptide repeat-containing protein [Cerasicoccus frondis]|uniref:pentapeptide repeat-containing protein n=1 Tax=Cerasicoccus frondis TaxID=490090 RepID=UPI0028527F87|nr:pentapeptide repeat-containing protein [Cerasicoccus frondis]
MNSDKSQDREKSIQEIEADLIRQDHRLVPLCITFFRRGKWEKGDLRRKASIEALLWKLLSPETAAFTVGGIIGILTLIVLLEQTRQMTKQTKNIKEQSGLLEAQNILLTIQNDHFKEQNEYFKTQNQYFKDQNDSITAQIDMARLAEKRQRRTTLADFLFSASDTDVTLPRVNPKLRGAALVEYLPLAKEFEIKPSGIDSNKTLSFDDIFLNNVRIYDLDLSRVSLQRASLPSANFIGCSFDSAIMSNVRADEVIFTKCELEGINFLDCELNQSTFDSTLLDRSQFDGCSLTRANFINCNVFSKTFNECVIDQALFDNIILDGVSFEGSTLLGCDIRNIKAVSKIQFKNTDISAVRFPPIEFAQSKFSRIDAKFAYMRSTKFFECEFLAFESSGIDIVSSTFERCRIWECNFSRARAMGASFKNTAFDRTDFTEANFSYASFVKCSFEGAICTKMKVYYADLKDTDITQAQANQMLGNTETQLPDAITRPISWPMPQGITDPGANGRQFTAAHFDDDRPKFRETDVDGLKIFINSDPKVW